MGLALLDEKDECWKKVFKLNTFIPIPGDLLLEDVLHVVHDLVGDVDLVGGQPGLGYEPV